MNRKFGSAFILLRFTFFMLQFPVIRGIAQVQHINYWEDPGINGINKEKPHAYSFLFEEKANNAMLQEYWDVIYVDSSLTGAAIWEWVDQGLAKKKDEK